MDAPPREYTTEEVREQFLQHVRAQIEYWESIAGPISSRAKLEGLAFSILSTLDGCAAVLPGFVVVAQPHPDDRAFLTGQGLNYYRPRAAVVGDISGSLHELFSGSRCGKDGDGTESKTQAGENHS